MGRESRIISLRDLHLLLSESAYVLSDSVCKAAPSPASSRPTRCPRPPTHYRMRQVYFECNPYNPGRPPGLWPVRPHPGTGNYRNRPRIATSCAPARLHAVSPPSPYFPAQCTRSSLPHRSQTWIDSPHPNPAAIRRNRSINDVWRNRSTGGTARYSWRRILSAEECYP